MKKQNTDNKATTITVASGKGGVGKTSICLVMGSVLSLLGKKVLLVDFDIATHGMTYFILEKIPKKSLGIIELLRDPQLKPEVVHYETNYHILPSTTKLKTPDIADIESNYEQFSMIMKNTLTNFSNEYDYILIDCQAGTTNAVRSAIEVSTKVLIVAEADPISVWAIKNIEYEFGKILPHETFGLINKLFLEEKERYKDIVQYSRLMKFLPPLPFDMEVRRKFARRLIPADLENPTEFLIALCYVIRDLLPEMEKDIGGYLKQVKMSRTKDLESELAEVESEIAEVRRNVVSIQSNSESGYEWTKRTILMSIIISSLAVSMFSLFTGMLNIYISPMWIVFIAGAMLAGISQFFLLSSAKRRRRRERVRQFKEALQTRLEELIERRRRLEILLIEQKKPFI